MDARKAFHIMEKTRLMEAEKVLNTIIDEMGRVCENFELCWHPACADSAGAASLALEYFKKFPSGRIVFE